ncbi:hypothetical protein ABIC65_002592 [Sphingomonas trueperi]|uniref:hypothetical protein n=1 Tax=Sphingomonas trueperi TaxID=53317 RepID=UPI00339361A6
MRVDKFRSSAQQPNRGSLRLVGVIAIAAGFAGTSAAMSEGPLTPLLSLSAALVTTASIGLGAVCFSRSSTVQPFSRDFSTTPAVANEPSMVEIAAAANSLMSATFRVAAASRWIEAGGPDAPAGLASLKLGLSDLQRSCAAVRKLLEDLGKASGNLELDNLKNPCQPASAFSTSDD